MFLCYYYYDYFYIYLFRSYYYYCYYYMCSSSYWCLWCIYSFVGNNNQFSRPQVTSQTKPCPPLASFHGSKGSSAMPTTPVSSTQPVESLQAWCPTTTTQCELIACTNSADELVLHRSNTLTPLCSDWLGFGQTHRSSCLTIQSFCSWDDYGKNSWPWITSWTPSGPIPN